MLPAPLCKPPRSLNTCLSHREHRKVHPSNTDWYRNTRNEKETKHNVTHREDRQAVLGKAVPSIGHCPFPLNDFAPHPPTQASSLSSVISSWPCPQRRAEFTYEKTAAGSREPFRLSFCPGDFSLTKSLALSHEPWGGRNRVHSI